MALIFKLSSFSAQTPLIIEMLLRTADFKEHSAQILWAFTQIPDLNNFTFVKTTGANEWHTLYLVSLKYLLCPLSLWTHIFTAGLSVFSLTAIRIQYKYQLLLTLWPSLSVLCKLKRKLLSCRWLLHRGWDKTLNIRAHYQAVLAAVWGFVQWKCTRQPMDSRKK